MATVRILGRIVPQSSPPNKEEWQKFKEEAARELAKIDEEDEDSDDDIFMDEDCPPTTDEESEWRRHMMRKYNTRNITGELIELEKSQMSAEERAAYDYMIAKKDYIIEVLKEHGGMKYGELKKYLKDHPYIPSDIDKQNSINTDYGIAI